MERNQFGFITILVMILAGTALIPSGIGNMLRNQSAGAPATASKGGTPTTLVQNAKTGSASSNNPAIALVCGFLGGSDATEAMSTNDQGTTTCDKVRDRFARGFTIETLIATLPDPVETRLGSQFDTYLDAIEQAANAAGYVMDRFDLVWSKDHGAGDRTAEGGTLSIEDSSPVPAGDAVRTTDGHPVKLTYTPSSDSDPEKKPAVFLLRNDNGIRNQRKLLALFVVGESPTRGVHRQAMLNALLYARELTAWWHERSLATRSGPTPPNSLKGAKAQAVPSPSATPIPSATLICDDVRILGPSYSGSLLSLQLILSNWRVGCETQGTAPYVHMISGSATNISPDDLSSALNSKDPVMSLQTTIGQDGDLYWALKNDTEKTLGLREARLAFVHEGNTSYGANFKNRQSYTAYRFFDLQFPLHIAELQKAAAENERMGSPQASAVRLRSQLPLAGMESTRDKDLVPLFSAAEANTLELQLDEMLKTVAERRIEHVVLGATDVHDIAFVAHKVKQCCPNTQLIAITSDLLFAHEDVNPDTRGMLLLTTYPLLGTNQSWSWPFGGRSGRRLFASDTTEGVYNAASLLLDGSGEGLSEYGEPFQPYKHSVVPHPVPWLTIVGNGAIWPVGVLDEAGRSDPSFATPSSSSFDLDSKHSRTLIRVFPSELLPVSSMIQICTWDLVCGVLAWLILMSGGESEGVPIIVFSLFGPSVIRSMAMSRNFAVFSIASFLSVPPSLFTVIFSRTLFRSAFNQEVDFTAVGYFPIDFVWGLSLTACLLTLMALLSTAARLFHAEAPLDLPLDDKGNAGLASGSPLLWSTGLMKAGHLAFVAAIVGILCPCLALFGWGQRQLHLQPFFALLRGLNLSSGVSPLRPPLLALAATLILFIEYLHVQSFTEHRPIRRHNGIKPLFLDFETESFGGVGTLERQSIDPWVKPFFATGYFPYAIAFSGALGFGYLLTTGIYPVDGFYFEIAFVALAMFFYLFLFITFMRLITTWLAVKRLLRYLYNHPSRVFYDELRKLIPGDSSNTINLFSRQPNTGMFTVSFERLLNLVALAKREDQPKRQALVPNRVDTILIGKLRDHRGSLEEALTRMREIRSPGITPLYDTPASVPLTVPEWKKTVENIYAAKLAMLQAAQSAAKIAEEAWGCDWVRSDTASRVEKAGGKILHECGVLVASRVGDLVRNILPQLQTYAMMGTVGTMVMLLAISSYPFPHEDTLLWFNWFAIGAAVAVTVWVYASMNRDNVLSLISGTTPGSLNWNAGFLGQLLVHGLIPILLLLGVQFPSSVSNALSSIGGFFGKGG